MPANAERPTGVGLDELLATALRIADQDGLAGLTMRRLAKELGIGVMTVYGHVRTKEELLDGVVETAVRELEIPSEGAWDERLTTLFTNLRELLHRHPVVLHADALRPMTGPAALTAADAALGMLAEAGLDGTAAIDGLSALISYTFGGALFRLPTNGDGRDHYERNVRGADPAENPHLARLAEAFLERGSDREFAVGLDVLISGLTHRRAP